MAKGLAFVVSAPSGSGKGTVLKEVLKLVPGLMLSVSYTTRLPRPGEVDGASYHFTGRNQFQTLIQADDFLEWAEVHGNLYGTSRLAVEKLLAEGIDVILEIDIQGAEQALRKMTPPPVTIFLIPPSLAEIERRLRGRATDSEDVLALRLHNAAEEMRAASSYQYLVVNNRLDEAVQQVAAVIYAERARNRRLLSGAPALLWGA
ncbi:MAG: guanylate kinase [Desulfobulbaceae bacterium]|jgi:guanylate kinase|nr:guanylate kinase [Desulfobulbaceae bacterium]